MSDNNNIDPNATPEPAASLPPAGWFPDPHDAGAQRYWDGVQWTSHTAPAGGLAGGATSDASTTPVASSAQTVAPGAGGAAAMPIARGVKLRWWQWVLIAVGVLILISVIGGALGGSRPTADSSEVQTSPKTEATSEPVEEVVDEREAIPSLVGLTVAEARAALEAVGFVITTPNGTGDDWIVRTQTLSEGRQADAGTEVLVTAEAPKPVYTLAQQNAIRQAQAYLDFSGFSRVGLIGQLEYEGYSTEDATFGADNAGADWNAEAAEKAASYLEFTSFSRQGLYDQLVYEGFTDAEIEFGLAAVGY